MGVDPSGAMILGQLFYLFLSSWWCSLAIIASIHCISGISPMMQHPVQSYNDLSPNTYKSAMWLNPNLSLNGVKTPSSPLQMCPFRFPFRTEADTSAAASCTTIGPWSRLRTAAPSWTRNAVTPEWLLCLFLFWISVGPWTETDSR